MNSLVEGSLAMGGLFTAFLVAYWTLKAFEPKGEVILVTAEQPRYKKAA